MEKSLTYKSLQDSPAQLHRTKSLPSERNSSKDGGYEALTRTLSAGSPSDWRISKATKETGHTDETKTEVPNTTGSGSSDAGTSHTDCEAKRRRRQQLDKMKQKVEMGAKSWEEALQNLQKWKLESQEKAEEIITKRQQEFNESVIKDWENNLSKLEEELPETELMGEKYHDIKETTYKNHEERRKETITILRKRLKNMLSICKDIENMINKERSEKIIEEMDEAWWFGKNIGERVPEE